MTAALRNACVIGVVAVISALGAVLEAADQQFKIEPAPASVCAGQKATLKVSGFADPVNVDWQIEPKDAGKIDKANGSATYTAPSFPPSDPAHPVMRTAYYGPAILTATDQNDKSKSATATITLTGPCVEPLTGELTRATIGYEQVGAAGTDSSRKYSLDFFISRPLPFSGSQKNAGTRDENDVYFGPRVRWWGDIRVASYPVQVNSNVAQFVQGFATNVGNVALNQLVQSAEFLTGPEIRVAQSAKARDSVTDQSRQRFALMVFGGVGGIGPLSPSDNATVFVVPTDKTSPQYLALAQAYGPIGSKYVAFLPPAQSRFVHEWGVGLRLYTFYAQDTAQAEPLKGAPAVVDVSLGRNDLVSPTGAVWHASASYPFALGNRSDPSTLIIYLYGEVTMGLGGSQTATASNPLYLAPATDTAGAPVALTSPDVTILFVSRNIRDTYRIGVSIDLLRVWNKLTQSK